MTFTWTEWEAEQGTGYGLQDALAGVLVGFQNSSDPSDLTNTGILCEPGPLYRLEFNGYRMSVDSTGTVKTCKPTNSSFLGHKLSFVTTTMGNEVAVGTAARGRTRYDGEQAVTDDKVDLTFMQPRDQFAIQVLNAMLIHAGHPESFDDTKCLMFSKAAYRFAQAMMIAAAATRYGQSTEQSEAVADVRTEDLENNTEKLLYNISQLLAKGIAVKGETPAEGETATPIVAKVTEVTEVKKVTEVSDIKKVTEISDVKKVSQLPGITFSGTPTVNVNGFDDIVEGIGEIADNFSIPNRGTISVKVGIFNSLYIRFEVVNYMAYSDVSVYLELSVKELDTVTTRKVGHIIPKGSVVTLMPLDDAVTEITSITSKSVRGKGGNDPNSYSLINA